MITDGVSVELSDRRPDFSDSTRGPCGLPWQWRLFPWELRRRAGEAGQPPCESVENNHHHGRWFLFSPKWIWRMERKVLSPICTPYGSSESVVRTVCMQQPVRPSRYMRYYCTEYIWTHRAMPITGAHRGSGLEGIRSMIMTAYRLTAF